MTKSDKFFTVDIERFKPGELINFDAYIYLHLNKKMIPFLQKGMLLTKERIDKFKKYKIFKTFSDKNDIAAYVEYLHKTNQEIPAKLSLSSFINGVLEENVETMFVPSNSMEIARRKLGKTLPPIQYTRDEDTKKKDQKTVSSKTSVLPKEAISATLLDKTEELPEQPQTIIAKQEDEAEEPVFVIPTKLKSEEERKEIASTLNEISTLKPEERQEVYEAEATYYKEIFENDKIDNKEKARLIQGKAAEMAEEMFVTIVKGKPTEPPPKNQMINHCKNIVSGILKLAHSEEKNNLYETIMKMKDMSDDIYEHSVYVSTFATIFAMGAGITDKRLIAEIGLGGLLHDVGIGRLEDPTMMFKEEKMTYGDKTKYEKHCQHGLDIIKETNSQTSKIVLEIIFKHHEAYDGSGFPNKCKKKDVPDYVGLVSMADKFDMLTNKGLHPIEALHRMHYENNNFIRTSLILYRPPLLNAIMDFFNLEARFNEFMDKKTPADKNALAEKLKTGT